MARNRGGDSFVAHTESAVAPVKSSAICDYVAPRFRESATPEAIISTICAPHSGRNCRRSAIGILINLSWSSLQAFLEPSWIARILKINDLRNQKNRKTRSSTYESAKSG